MRIFITGGSGFIGLPTAKLFAQRGHRLLFLSRNPKKLQTEIHGAKITFAKGDLSNISSWANALKRFKPDAAVHLAWEGIPDYGPAMSAKNLAHGIELFELLGKIGVNKIVAAGSCWEYGADSGVLSEDMGVQPKNAFSAAKNALHWLGAEIAREHGAQFAWARIFFAYGPRQRRESLIPSLIERHRLGREAKLNNPNGVNDFVYIDDVARALVALTLKRLPEHISLYNVGSGILTKTKDIADLVYGKRGSPRRAATGGFRADISKIRKEIGWRPRVTIAEGIKKTVHYYSHG